MTEAAVREAVLARADALARRDRDALTRLLHEQFAWTSHRGERFDRDGYLAANTAAELRWSRQDLEQMRIAVVGDVAVVRAMAVDHVERSGDAMVFRMPMTQTWVFADGRWQCLAGHAGPLVGPRTE